MKIVCCVPIKLKNDRLPGKNTKEFYNGKPLIHFILESLLQITLLDEVYVYCSQDDIIKYLLPGVHYLKRPESLDTSLTTPQNIISSFMDQVDADIYMFSHATSPFVSVKHLEQCIKAVLIDGFDSAFTAKKIQSLLWSELVQPMNFDPGNIPRTQELKPIYAEVSAAYVFTKSVFQNTNRRIAGKSKIIEVTDIESIDIDYLDTFIMANAIYYFQNEKRMMKCTKDGF